MAKTEIATFANGCFWCTEALFKRLNGVIEVTSGYIGGHIKNPSYEEVCSGTTGHAEALQIEYDPSTITYEELLDVFWHTHNPTTLNQQGNDIGTQYRSAVFYHSNDQKKKAEHSRSKIEQEKLYSEPVVTEIVPSTDFYPAENYHTNYYDNNPSKPYCSIVISPKLQNFMQKYATLVKKEYQ